jgi:hypothetical protein
MEVLYMGIDIETELRTNIYELYALVSARNDLVKVLDNNYEVLYDLEEYIEELTNRIQYTEINIEVLREVMDK